MNCPSCGKQLPDKPNIVMNYCPMCGDKLYDPGIKYLMEIQFAGQRDAESTVMMIYVDERQFFKVIPGENICFALEAGFHTIKFRYKIRTKVISFLVTSSYVIKTYYNSLSGLIETNINIVEDSSGGIDAETLAEKELTQPVLESENGERAFDIMLGQDEPEYEMKVTSGLKEGMLRLYYERIEFTAWSDRKVDVVPYRQIVAVRKKMGAIDVECAGNVHKVYSIPKDIYNEILAFLTNKVSEARENM